MSTYTLKKIYIGNLGPNVTKDDIVQLFGLESTPLIKKTSKVELNLGNDTDQNEKTRCCHGIRRHHRRLLEV